MEYSTSIIILTLNAENEIEKILKKIDFSKYNVLIIDSSSDDNTVEICKRYGCQINIIERNEFNHGATREYARKQTNTDIIIFLTQDAIPVRNNTFDKLIEPIQQGIASVSYGKQIPRKTAKILESFPREFNYGEKEYLRSFGDVKKFGVHTFFCSDSFSAYNNNHLDDVGGIDPAIVSEDYFTVSKLLKNGKSIAYIPSAAVVHSHNYTLAQEFQRYFDTGFARAERPWIQQVVGNAENRGIKYFIMLFKKLVYDNPFLIPYAIIQSMLKWLGYRIGFHGRYFPDWVKIAFSGQKYYWRSKYYDR